MIIYIFDFSDLPDDELCATRERCRTRPRETSRDGDQHLDADRRAVALTDWPVALAGSALVVGRPMRVKALAVTARAAAVARQADSPMRGAVRLAAVGTEPGVVVELGGAHPLVAVGLGEGPGQRGRPQRAISGSVTCSDAPGAGHLRSG